MKVKNIVVTGGAGMIGSHLVDRLLLTEDYHVTVIDDLSNGKFENLKQSLGKNFEFFKYDVTNPLPDLKADVIYHLACHPRSMSLQDPQRDVEVNVIGMINVLELAQKNDSLVVFSSNSGIYDTSIIQLEERGINESDPDKPLSPYDLDKQAAEGFCKIYAEQYGVRSVIFRFATVYGSRQNITEGWKPVVAEFIDCVKHDRSPTIYWDGEQTRDFIHVSDVVNALWIAMHRKKAVGETMILGTDIETSINSVFNIVCMILDKEIEPIRLAKKPADYRRMRYSYRKAENILHWKPKVNVEEGIRRILNEAT